MLQQFIVYVTSAALVIGTVPAPVAAQTAPAPVIAQAAAADQAAPAQSGEVEKFSAAQLDALLAPIALYPDVLLDPGFDGGDLSARHRGSQPMAGAGQ